MKAIKAAAKIIKNFSLFKIPVLALILFFIASPVLAYQIETISDTNIKGDFAIGPGKTEIIIDPGQKFTKEITITNRLGKTMAFKVEVEDFTGTQDPNIAVNLLGKQTGPFSLKNYLKPELNEFVLKHGERMVLPVVLAVPTSTQPGGLYGAVIISTNPGAIEQTNGQTAAQSQIRTVSRIASLFFVRINGEIKEEGKIKSFSTDSKYYESSPINFKILSENTGSVHLNPYGIIEISNIFGKKVGEVEISPFYVLPNSVKLREVQWDRGMLFGLYRAELSLNRGYQDVIDQKIVYFWVLPYKIIILILLVIVLLAGSITWLIKNFELRKKK